MLQFHKKKARGDEFRCQSTKLLLSQSWIHPSQKCVFMSGGKWESKDTVLPPKCCKFKRWNVFFPWLNSIVNLKIEVSSLQGPFQNFLYDFLPPSYRTTKIEEFPRLCRIFVVFECVQSWITWRREIVQQVFRGVVVKGKLQSSSPSWIQWWKKFVKVSKDFWICSILREKDSILAFPLC